MSPLQEAPATENFPKTRRITATNRRAIEGFSHVGSWRGTVSRTGDRGAVSPRRLLVAVAALGWLTRPDSLASQTPTGSRRGRYD
jgi:hypothetical protein